MAFPNYTLADITGGALNEGQLDDEIKADEIVTPFSGATFLDIVRTLPSAFVVNFSAGLTAPDITRVDTLVADHVAGPRNIFLESWSILPESHNATGSFTTAAALRFRPGGLGNVIGNLRIRLIGECSSSGGTMTIRLLEQDPDGSNSVTIIDSDQGDSGGVFLGFDEVSSNLRAGVWTYVLRVRANGGTSSIRRVTAILRERIPAT